MAHSGVRGLCSLLWFLDSEAFDFFLRCKSNFKASEARSVTILKEGKVTEAEPQQGACVRACSEKACVMQKRVQWGSACGEKVHWGNKNGDFLQMQLNLARAN